MEEQKRNPAAGLSESEQVQVRRQKLADLQAAGHDPFTLTKFPQDAYSADLKEEFKDLPNETDSGNRFYFIGNFLDHFFVIPVIPFNNLNSRVCFFIIGLNPQAETGQSCRDRRNFKCQTLQRSVSPRLVIRGENGQIHSHKQIIIRHVKHTVITIQIAWREKDLHPVPRLIR